mmetsp:Transcript_124049/g.356152  ORF Transcript_124049/g.356152 Transcript_124049/m.356152 type:complete len:353 (+) Transcript_124049:144-1202(+)
MHHVVLPPIRQDAPVDRSGDALLGSAVAEDRAQHLGKLVLKPLAIPVELRVRARDEHLDAALRQKDLRVGDDSGLAVIGAIIAVEPLRKRVPLLVQAPVRLRRVGDVVDEPALDKDLEQMPGLPALAGLPAELGDIQAVALAKRDDAFGELLHLALRHETRLQQVLQHAGEGDVLLAVAMHEHDGRGRFWTQRHQRAHRGDRHLPVLGMVVSLVGGELRRVSAQERSGVRSLGKLAHEQAWQRRSMRWEAEENLGDRCVDFVDQGGEGIGVVQNCPLAAVLLLIPEQLLKALHRMGGVLDDLQLQLRRVAPSALGAIPLLQLQRLMGAARGHQGLRRRRRCRLGRPRQRLDL